MAERSSISSSERSQPGRGRPRAVVLAAIIVVAVEVVLHLAPDSKLLGYDQGLGAYADIRHTLEQRGSADVVSLGTSRARESLLLPEIARRASEHLDRGITAASYSCPGSHANEMLQVAQLVVASPRRPRVVLYFVSPSMITGEDVNETRLEILGVEPDWRAHGIGQTIATWLSRPLRRGRYWLDRHYLTFRHRLRLRHVMLSAMRGRRPVSAVQGDETIWQTYVPARSLAQGSLDTALVNAAIGRMLETDGTYRVEPRQMAALEQTIALCEEHGIPIVVLAAAVSPDLDAMLPEQLRRDFMDALTSVTSQHGLPLLTMDDLGLELTRADFREHSHLNRSGAAKVTDAIWTRVLGPLLASDLAAGDP